MVGSCSLQNRLICRDDNFVGFGVPPFMDVYETVITKDDERAAVVAVVGRRYSLCRIEESVSELSSCFFIATIALHSKANTKFFVLTCKQSYL